VSEPRPVAEDRAAGPAVRLSGVRFTWPGRDAFGLTIGAFQAAQGERLLLVGPSGSGKSTLLSLIAGVIVPDTGSVEVLGTRLDRLAGPARDRFRAAHIGIIFQMFNLLPYLSVLDNVLLPLRFAPERRHRVVARRTTPEAEARRLLERLHLEPGLARRPASSLSVGQQQRVAAARALIGAPEIVIADEPTSALDRDRQAAFLDLIAAELAAAGGTLLMVSHDPTLGDRFERVVRLQSVLAPERAELAA